MRKDVTITASPIGIAGSELIRVTACEEEEKGCPGQVNFSCLVGKIRVGK